MDQPAPEAERELDTLLRDSALALLGAARATLDALEAVISTPGGVPAMTRLLTDLVRGAMATEAPTTPKPETGNSEAGDGDGLHHIEVR
jgi:hypothetical protein